jgi:AraC-like DNA-binding protein
MRFKYFIRSTTFYCCIILYLLILTFLPNSLKAQTNIKTNYANSLQNKTFKELEQLSKEALSTPDSIVLDIYRKAYLKKAKSENVKLEMARAYYFYITWENLERDIQYSDSIIEITLDSNHKSYPTNGYLIKAQLYYYNSDFNKALDNYIIAAEWANKKNYKPLQIEATLGIAAIKNVWGLHESALDIYRTIFSDIIKTPNYLDTFYSDYILLANNLSLSYVRNNQPDSALVISRSAMIKALKKKDMPSYYDLGKVHANANFYLKKYPQTLDSLKKFSSNYSGLVLADSYYMMGKVYQYRNNEPLMIHYFKKIDSIHQVLNDPFPELKEVYNVLYRNAGKYHDKDTQLNYLNQLLKADSILDRNYMSINKKVYSEYDIPNLQKEKQQLEMKLNNRKQLLILSTLSVVILVVFLIYYYKRQQRFKMKFQELLQADNINFQKVEIQDPERMPLEISEQIVADVLKNMSKFESSQGYLCKDITLNSLAKDFKTNSSYLSSIINHVKQTNFASYIRDLRITHAINCIKQKRGDYLKYSMNGLADEFGFTTAASFSKAFREKTDIKPSYFLEQLRKEK